MPCRPPPLRSTRSPAYWACCNRKKDEVPAEVTELVEKRAAAKKAKDWATADAIRAQLTELGWAVKDTAQGPQLSKL